MTRILGENPNHQVSNLANLTHLGTYLINSNENVFQSSKHNGCFLTTYRMLRMSKCISY